jgi:hypothetical protein
MTFMAAMFDPKRRRRKPWDERASPFFHLDGGRRISIRFV